MSIQANNIDPIDVKELVNEALKQEGTYLKDKALRRSLQMFNAYQRALDAAKDLNNKAISKIRELSKPKP